jgi:hypothetical protein
LIAAAISFIASVPWSAEITWRAKNKAISRERVLTATKKTTQFSGDILPPRGDSSRSPQDKTGLNTKLAFVAGIADSVNNDTTSRFVTLPSRSVFYFFDSITPLDDNVKPVTIARRLKRRRFFL